MGYIGGKRDTSALCGGGTAVASRRTASLCLAGRWFNKRGCHQYSFETGGGGELGEKGVVMFNTNSVDKEHVLLLTKLQRGKGGGKGGM